MPITDKTRKILWARSGNRCAICRKELVMASSSSGDEESVIGDECHIIAREPAGPRGSHSSRNDAQSDDPDNLILLCKVHHKQIDDQCLEFTVERLRDTKQRHEQWVCSRLSQRPDKREPIHLRRIHTGVEFFACIDGTMAQATSHAEPATADEADLLGGFLQDARDYGDLYADMEPAQRVRYAFDMNQTFAALKSTGFVVHAGKGIRTMRFGPSAEQRVDWQICVIHVARIEDEREFVYTE